MRKSLLAIMALAAACTTAAAGPHEKHKKNNPASDSPVAVTCATVVSAAAKYPLTKNFVKDIHTAQRAFNYCMYAGHIVVSATFHPKELRRPRRNTAESGAFM